MRSTNSNNSKKATISTPTKDALSLHHHNITAMFSLSAKALSSSPKHTAAHPKPTSAKHTASRLLPASTPRFNPKSAHPKLANPKSANPKPRLSLTPTGSSSSATPTLATTATLFLHHRKPHSVKMPCHAPITRVSSTPTRVHHHQPHHHPHLLLCFLLFIFQLSSSFAYNVTSSSPASPSATIGSTTNRSSRQIDDLLSPAPLLMHRKDEEADTGALAQPANNEQPFATFVYTALINDKVQLPCDINPPSSDDQMLLVLWYKDDQLAPILTLDGRKNSADAGATISLPYLQGRAYFNIHGRPAHLLIDPVAASDEGEYRCRVDFRKARTVNTVISLKVITPPQVPKITDVDGNALSGVVGPYNEGDELTLTCLTKGGKPRPSLIWWRDYAIIDDSFEFDDRDVTTNELIIARLARHHLLAIIMCQAINSNITGPASNSITLDINLKPTEVRITQLTPVLVAGNDALFECNTFGSRPMPAIYWRFDGRKYETRIHGEQQTTSTLTLRLDRQHRGLKVECIVENIRIPGSAIRDQLLLDVQYPPLLSLQLGAPSLSLDSVQEGIDIYFDCHLDANPPPTTPITWLFNGRTLLPEPGVIESNQSLVLQGVQRWRSGGYQCQCANQQGTVLSNEIDLQIKFAPVCKQPYTLIYGLNLNELIQIGCDVEARPSKVSFSWKFEKSTNLANFVQINDTKSLLEYTPRSRDQYGLIECTAKNDIGIQREPCRYLIAPLAGPFFPYNCAVANQSDSTLSIRCDGSIIANATTSEGSQTANNNFRPGPNFEDLEEEEDLDEEDDGQIKYHSQKVAISTRQRKFGESTQIPAQNLSTSDIYALYFAPDVDPGTADDDLDGGSGGDQKPANNKHQTYRNGAGQMVSGGGKMSQSQLGASASLLLNELMPKFNSYQINQSPHLFAYPPTYYICEIYALTPRPTLIKNVTIDAVGRRIMNPFNGSFSFLVDTLPPNTPLRVNIYARNGRKRSPGWVELDARTQRAAERRIDSAHQGAAGGGGQESSVARGRKSSFFEELYGGYGRFRSKHLVVGLLIGAVAVAVFVAILLIVVASLRKQNNSSMQPQETRMSILNEKSNGSSAFKRKCSRDVLQSSRRPSTQLNLEDFKETTFMERTEDGEHHLKGTTIDVLPGNTSGIIYGDYGHYGLDNDDDSSMRSDHQLIQQQQTGSGGQLDHKYYQRSSSGQNGGRGGPPSYFDLEQSVIGGSALVGDPISGSGPTRTFVNLISPGGGGGGGSGVQVEAKPDLIQTATIYSNAGAKDPNGGAIFDTISFESHGGGGVAADGGAYDMSQMPTMIAVAGEEISGNIIHFSSPIRKYDPTIGTVITSAHHPHGGTLHRHRYIGHHPLMTSTEGGPSPSSSSSGGTTTSSLFATLPRGGGGGGGGGGASNGAAIMNTTNLPPHHHQHHHLGGSNSLLLDSGGGGPGHQKQQQQQQSYIYIQHLGPEHLGSEETSNSGN